MSIQAPGSLCELFICCHLLIKLVLFIKLVLRNSEFQRNWGEMALKMSLQWNYFKVCKSGITHKSYNCMGSRSCIRISVQFGLKHVFAYGSRLNRCHLEWFMWSGESENLFVPTVKGSVCKTPLQEHLFFFFLLQICFDISFFWLSCLLKVPGRKRHDTAYTPMVVLVFQREEFASRTSSSSEHKELLTRGKTCNSKVARQGKL